MKCLFTDIEKTTSADGVVKLSLTTHKDYKYLADKVYQLIKQGLSEGKESLTATFKWKAKDRTLAQNALLWKLIDIYLKERDGRTTNEAKDELYIQWLKKYGKSVIVPMFEKSADELKKLYKDTTIIDKRMMIDENTNMKVECTIVRCFIGSSEYETKEMSDLIEGGLDELAKRGIDTELYKLEMRGLI